MVSLGAILLGLIAFYSDISAVSFLWVGYSFSTYYPAVSPISCNLELELFKLDFTAVDSFMHVSWEIDCRLIGKSQPQPGK